MRYQKLTDAQKAMYPSIHYTGSVRGMKEMGFWGKHDICVRCGSYIYNLSKPINPQHNIFGPRWYPTT